MLGVVLGSFLALVGVQAAHSHDSAVPVDSCAVCALAHKTQRAAPLAAPAISVSLCWLPVAPAVERAGEAVSVRAAQARAPPSLS